MNCSNDGGGGDILVLNKLPAICQKLFMMYSQISIYRTRLIRHLVYIELKSKSCQLTVIIAVHVGFFEHGYIELLAIAKLSFSPCQLKQPLIL